MSFSKRVELLLEKKNPKLSSFIFEEKEKEEESGAGSLFDMKDEDEEANDSEDEETSDSEDDAPEDTEADSADSESDEEASSDVTKQQIETLTTQIEAIKATIDKVNKDDGTQSIESFIAGVVAKEVEEGDVNESYYNKSSISKFLLTEDADLEDIEKNIDVLDRVLTKGSDLVDKFKKGKEVDISSYVAAAVNACKN